MRIYHGILANQAQTRVCNRTKVAPYTPEARGPLQFAGNDGSTHHCILLYVARCVHAPSSRHWPELWNNALEHCEVDTIWYRGEQQALGLERWRCRFRRLREIGQCHWAIRCGCGDGQSKARLWQSTSTQAMNTAIPCSSFDPQSS